MSKVGTRVYLADGTYWQTLIRPNPPPSCLGIGPWNFVLVDGDHLREVKMTDGTQYAHIALTYRSETPEEIAEEPHKVKQPGG